MRWIMSETGARDAEALARAAALPPMIARILMSRGIARHEEARLFLSPCISDLHDPLLMAGMDEATARLRLAADRGERVLVFADYDVDGVTSAAAMGRILELLGLRYTVCHPDRFTEGYGFSRRGVNAAKERGCSLIITLDCGTEAAAPIAEANAAGIGVIVIDHHLQRGPLPPADAIVNPSREECPYPFGSLVSAGLVLKFARALVEKVALPVPWAEILQLAALGTVADVAPLRDENRIITLLGLEAINRAPLAGIAALARAAGLGTDRLRASNLAFQLGPRLNAAGRVGSASMATQLLLDPDPGACRPLAAELSRLNGERQALERSIAEEAVAQIEEGGGSGRRKVLVAAGSGWHRGVVGIVAARLLERFYRPAVVIAIEGETGHGSARSIPGFDMFGALRRCQDLFSSFGGHCHAAGISLPSRNVDLFRERINEPADAALTEDLLTPALAVDASARLEELTFDLVRMIDRMEPFGAGNPRPVLASRNVVIKGPPRRIGKGGRHVSLRLSPAGAPGVIRECIGWNMADRLAAAGGATLDAAYSPQIDEWNGMPRVRLALKDLRPARTDGGSAF